MREGLLSQTVVDLIKRTLPRKEDYSEQLPIDCFVQVVVDKRHAFESVRKRRSHDWTLSTELVHASDLVTSMLLNRLIDQNVEDDVPYVAWRVHSKRVPADGRNRYAC